MTTITKKNKGWVAGLFAAVAASLCCITPVLTFLGGASGLASAFSWTERFRPYFIGLTIAVFAFAWYQKLKPKTQIDCDCEADDNPTFWQSNLFLAIVTVVAALLIAFPYYANVFYPKSQVAKAVIVDRNNIQTVEFNIKGMTCEGCTKHINSELSKTTGVMEFTTSYEKGNSLVKFDNSKTSVDSLISVITKTGYTITSQSVMNK